MKRTLHFLSLLLLVLCISIATQSCRDDDDSNNSCDLKASLNSPVQDMQIASGENIPLDIEFSACTPIQSYFVRIRNTNTDKLVFILSEFVDSETIRVNPDFSLTVSETANMDIEIRAEDADGNQIEEVIGSFELSAPTGNRVNLRFNLIYQGNTLNMGQRYQYPTGEEFEFTRFDMYMSDLSLKTNDGNSMLIKDIDYLEMTSAYQSSGSASQGYTYSVPGIAAGNFVGATFNIGISPALNATTPSDYPVSHPLGRTGDYWDGEGWMSYIFTSIEGRINVDTSNPDLEQGIALHLGSNNAFKTIDIDNAFAFLSDEGSEHFIDIDIDLIDLFVGQDGEIYDIVSIPQTHSTVHIPQVITLSNNLKNSINK